jgi:hypothetical protein
MVRADEWSDVRGEGGAQGGRRRSEHLWEWLAHLELRLNDDNETRRRRYCDGSGADAIIKQYFVSKWAPARTSLQPSAALVLYTVPAYWHLSDSDEVSAYTSAS